MKGLGRPLELSLLKNVFRDTEANKLAVLDVVGDLGVDSASDAVIVGVLQAEIDSVNKHALKRGFGSC